VLIRASDINMQPVHDAVSLVVMQASLANIDSVMVAGRWKKRHDRLLDVDLAPQLAALQASGQKIAKALSL
jgi:cytosine/adenosine deaminase-related metal-dependent hydrolase